MVGIVQTGNPSRLKALVENLETMPLDLDERLRYGTLSREDKEWCVDRYEELQLILKKLKSALWFVNINGTITITQRIVIAAEHLTTTDVANDTLITHGTPIPFRWNDPRTQDYSINPGVGQSVEPWVLLRDHAHNIDAYRINWTGTVLALEERMGIAMSVFDQPTYLQAMEWDATHNLVGVDWPIGWTVDLRQQIALGIPPL